MPNSPHIHGRLTEQGDFVKLKPFKEAFATHRKYVKVRRSQIREGTSTDSRDAPCLKFAGGREERARHVVWQDQRDGRLHCVARPHLQGLQAFHRQPHRPGAGARDPGKAHREARRAARAAGQPLHGACVVFPCFLRSRDECIRSRIDVGARARAPRTTSYTFLIFPHLAPHLLLLLLLIRCLYCLDETLYMDVWSSGKAKESYGCLMETLLLEQLREDRDLHMRLIEAQLDECEGDRSCSSSRSRSHSRRRPCARAPVSSCVRSDPEVLQNGRVPLK